MIILVEDKALQDFGISIARISLYKYATTHLTPIKHLHLAGIVTRQCHTKPRSKERLQFDSQDLFLLIRVLNIVYVDKGQMTAIRYACGPLLVL
jgi:hypothetical protein